MHQANAGNILGHRVKNRSGASPQPSGAKAAGKGHKPANPVGLPVCSPRKCSHHRGGPQWGVTVSHVWAQGGSERVRDSGYLGPPELWDYTGWPQSLSHHPQEKPPPPSDFLLMSSVGAHFCDWSLFPSVFIQMSNNIAPYGLLYPRAASFPVFSPSLLQGCFHPWLAWSCSHVFWPGLVLSQWLETLLFTN